MMDKERAELQYLREVAERECREIIAGPVRPGSHGKRYDEGKQDDTNEGGYET